MFESDTERAIQGYLLLQSLAGKWKEFNKTTTVEFRESACGSIIIETWYWPEKQIEALTVYFIDGKKLTATHYCPLGNQPTLKLLASDDDKRFNFHLVSATNLADKSHDHCESFWFEFDGSNQFTRSESYWDNGELDTQQLTYQRVLKNK